MKEATPADDEAHADAAEAEAKAAWHNDQFWSASVHACTPLAVWVAHFFACYVFVAVACHAGLDAPVAGMLSPLTLGLAILTLLALGWLVLMVVRADASFSFEREGADAKKPGRGAGNGPAFFRLGAAALSLVAVAWTSAPILMLSSCTQ